MACQDSMHQRQHENKNVIMDQRLLVFLKKKINKEIGKKRDCPQNVELIKGSRVSSSGGCVSRRVKGVCASQGKYLDLVHNHS